MDPILEALDKLREELSRALAAQKFRQIFPDFHGRDTEDFRFVDPESMAVDVHRLPGSNPDRVLSLNLTDPESMAVDVHRLPGSNPDRVLSLNLTDPDEEVLVGHLSQDAVNALARYLDQHRTDTADLAMTAVHIKGRARCDRARVGIGRCELDTGHLGTHRYGGAEWASTFDEPVSDACPWGYLSTGRAVRCDLTQPGHVTHTDGIMTWGEDSPAAVHTVTDVADYNPRAYMADETPVESCPGCIDAPEGGGDRG